MLFPSRLASSSLAFIAAGVLCSVNFGRAADTTIQWFGSVDTNFNNAANYNPNNAPSSTTVVEFAGSFTNQPVLGAPSNAAAIWLDSSTAQTVSFTGSGTETLTMASTGTGLLVDGRSSAIIETDGNTSGTASTLTFDSTTPLQVGSATSANANVFVDDNTAVTFNGTITAAHAPTNLDLRGTAAAGSITFNAAIQDTSTNTLTLTLGDNDGVAGTAYNGYSTNTGTITFNAANTYTGATVLGNATSGATSVTTVVLGHAGAFGTGAVSVYDAVVEGSNQSSGALASTVLSGTNKLVNNFTVNNYAVGGSPTGFAGNDTIEIGGNLTIAANGTLSNNIATSYMGSSQSLIIDGNVTATNTNDTINGTGTTLIKGSLTTPFGNSSSLTNNSNLTVMGVTYMGSSSVNQNIFFAGSGVTNLVGGLSNSLTINAGQHGFLNFTGTGTLELGAANNYQGPNYIGFGNTTSTYGGNGEGTILLNAGNGISTSLVTVLSSGTINLNGYSQTTAGLDIAGDNTTASHIGGIGSTASVIVPTGSVLYPKNNISYLPENSSGVAVATGQASITGGGQIYLAAGITSTVNLPASGTGSVPTGSPELVISVPIGGPGNIVKNGPGILALTNTNTYTGTTSVFNGNLQLDGSIGASSAVTVTGTAGSASTLSGIGTAFGNVTLGSSTGLPGILAPGDNGGAGTLSIGGNLTWYSGTSVNLSLNANAITTPYLSIGGTLSKASGTGTGYTFVFNNSNNPTAGTTYELVSIANGTNFVATDFTASGDLGTFSFDGSGNLDFTVVPEPSTWALLALGLGFVGWTARRRLRFSVRA